MVASSIPGLSGANLTGVGRSLSHWHPLVRPLVEGSFSERWEALKRLPLEDRQVLGQLVTLSGDGDEELVGFALMALGQSRSPVAVAPLVARLDDPDEELATMAGAALGQMGAIAVNALSQELAERPLSAAKRRHIVRALSHIAHPAVVEPLLSLAQAPEATVRAMALESLYPFKGMQMIPLLEAGVGDDAPLVRRAAVVGLGLWAMRQRQGDPSAGERGVITGWVGRVKTCLRDEDETVREQAAIALGRMATEEAILALATTAQSSDVPAPFQGLCLRVLAWVETAAAIRLLWQALLQQPDRTLWHTGLYLLGRVQEPALKSLAISYLGAALDHPLLTDATLRQTLALSVRWLSQTCGDSGLLAIQEKLRQDEEPLVRQHLGSL